jgi:hypothetical protein
MEQFKPSVFFFSSSIIGYHLYEEIIEHVKEINPN